MGEELPKVESITDLSASSRNRQLKGLSRFSSATAKKAVLGAVVAILILTVLEFPPPLGIETRRQSDVSAFWLVFFLVILVVEIATVPSIYKRPGVGGLLGIIAAMLNILQVAADQAHLMQPEVAPLAYSVLEGTVVIAAVGVLLVLAGLGLRVAW